MTTKRTRSGKVTEQLYDGHYDLRLPIPQLEELEEKTGMGCYAVMKALVDDNFKARYIIEVIRLGLIGSGVMSPMEAFSYVDRYLVKPKDKDGMTYLMDYHQAACNVMLASLYGPDDEPVPVPGNPEPEAMTPTHPASPDGEQSIELLEPSESSPLNSVA